MKNGNSFIVMRQFQKGKYVFLIYYILEYMKKIAGFSTVDIGYALKMILNIALTVGGMSLYSMQPCNSQ